MALSDDEIDALEASSQGAAHASAPRGLTDDEIDALETKAKVPQKGFAETAMRGAAQGILYGHTDELTAGLGALKDMATSEVPTGQPFARPGLTGYMKDLQDKFGNAYTSYIDKIRREDTKAQEQSPWIYGGAELAGGLASTAAGPGKALVPVKGAGMALNAGKIAATGGLMGAGLSEAPVTSPEFYKDTLVGGGLALGTAGALKGAGAVAKAVTPTNLARKASNVLLNTPEEITDLYIKNPEKVRGASTRFDVVNRYKDLLDKLKGEVTEGSAESRAILQAEGKTIPGSKIASILDDKARALSARSEGVWDDPQSEAAYKWLKDMSGKYAPEARAVPSPQFAPSTLEKFAGKPSIGLGDGYELLQRNSTKITLKSSPKTQSDTWIILKNGQEVGKIHSDVMKDTGAMIRQSEIESPHSGKGLGTKVYDILSRHYGSLESDANVSSPAARRVYEKLGAKATDTMNADGAPVLRIDPKTTEVVDRQLSTNRVKDALQALDRQTDWELAPGRFSRVDDNIRKGVRSNIDDMLKETSPAYAEQMRKVSADAALLSEAAPLAQNEGAMANVLRRLETDKYGGGQVPRDTLEKFDKRMGSDILEQAKYAHAREAFDKSATNGSRNVNLFSNMMRDVPVVKHLSPIVGGTVDKYGRKMTMSAVDFAAKLNKTWQSDGIQAFMRDIEPILFAARKGDPSAVLTMQLLEQVNPQAARAVRDEGAPK